MPVSVWAVFLCASVLFHDYSGLAVCGQGGQAMYGIKPD